MKKNLISVIILALLLVNVILTAIMMFGITNTNKKTAAIVTDIASVLQIELDNGTEEKEEVVVSMADTKPYDLSEEMTITLKKSADASDHFALVSITLSMNMKDEGYKTYGETISEKEGIIKGIINNTFSKYTLEDLKSDEDYGIIRADLLKQIQTKFESEFIFDIAFSNIVFQ